MSSTDDAARWECLSLDLAELLQAARRLEAIAGECVEDLSILAAVSAPQPSSLSSQRSASSTLSK